MTEPFVRLNAARCRAIAQVLIVNRDVVDLLASKGVDRDEVAMLCEQSARVAESTGAHSDAELRWEPA